VVEIDFFNNSIKQAITALNNTLIRCDCTKILKAIDEISFIKGLVIFIGVGKSGAILKKVASTATSLGIKSLYLNPIEAQHGDLGIVTPDDLVILVSKSGETDEIIKLVPSIKSKNSKIISITSDLASTLSKISDLSLYFDAGEESCPNGVAPTTSTTACIAFCDALIVSAAHKRGFSKQDFLQNHPAGALGRKLSTRVKDIMVPAPRESILSFDDSVMSILSGLTASNAGIVVGKKEGKNEWLGVVSDGDLRRAMSKYKTNFFELRLNDLASTDPVCIREKVLAAEAIDWFNKNGKPINSLIVLNDLDEIKGFLRIGDLIQKGFR
jgi:arabinose-5-phosphate isomerase